MSVPPGKDDDVHYGDEKTPFHRCLDTTRYAVAAAVTVLIASVIMYGVAVVPRPREPSLWIVGGVVSVQRSNNLTGQFNATVGGDSLTFRYAVRADNPSSRVRVYFTDTIAMLDSTKSSGEVLSFLTLRLPDVALEHNSVVNAEVETQTAVTTPDQGYYFKLLANGSIDGATMVLTGARTVENYSGHNKTDVPAVYYCSPLTVGRASAVDVRCTYQNKPSST
ncbi:hypothetical protein ZWY2020_010449 [Hordeum vulgare]|nr:hypothetical protein ZWY2020_010449 [Hordeum vulgare]